MLRSVVSGSTASSLRVYLDHNAASPLRPEAHAAIVSALDPRFQNPGSIHAEGQAARALVEQSRTRIASVLGDSAAEIVFTSGGSEASTSAIHGVVASRPGGGPVLTMEGESAHVEDPVGALEARGIPVLRLPRSSRGFADRKSVV